MHTREVIVGDKTLSFETGKLAKQAGGSVMVRYGDSVVLVTACRSSNAGFVDGSGDRAGPVVCTRQAGL